MHFRRTQNSWLSNSSRSARRILHSKNIKKTKRPPSLFAPLAIASLAALAPDVVARTCQVLWEKLVQTLITARLDWRVKFFALHLQCFTKMPMLQQQVQAFAASSQGLLQTEDRRTNQIVRWQDSGQSSCEDEHCLGNEQLLPKHPISIISHDGSEGWLKKIKTNNSQILFPSQKCLPPKKWSPPWPGHQTERPAGFESSPQDDSPAQPQHLKSPMEKKDW